jgi:hypothetical protein
MTLPARQRMYPLILSLHILFLLCPTDTLASITEWQLSVTNLTGGDVTGINLFVPEIPVAPSLVAVTPADAILLPFSVGGIYGIFPTLLHPNQTFVVDFQSAATPFTVEPSSNWAVGTQAPIPITPSDVAIIPAPSTVPEPASIGIWGLLAGFGAVGAYLRRRMSSARGR